MLSESSLLLQEYDETSKLIGNSTDPINTKTKVKYEFTVVSQLGTYGRLNITHNFGPHGCLDQYPVAP